MTNPMFNTQPNYSGVTIQIANPTVYARGGVNGGGVNQGVSGETPCQAYVCNPCSNGDCVVTSPMGRAGVGVDSSQRQSYDITGRAYAERVNGINTPINGVGETSVPNTYTTSPQQAIQPPPVAYPPQYYLNNYNVNSRDNIGNGLAEGQAEILKKLGGIEAGANGGNNPGLNPNSIQDTAGRAESGAVAKSYASTQEEPQDFTKSNAVIADLDARALAEQEAKKNTKEKRVVALTDEYIKSLENYLNNPNDEIRLMASKEILTRLDEDKDRFDDAALNALLNKMLQDPSKLVRVASLSAFAGQLASGNDFTVQLLHNIQQNPSADKEDVLQAADILLKMSAGTEIKHIPNPAVKSEPETDKK